LPIGKSPLSTETQTLALLQVAGMDLSSHAPIRAAVAYVGALVDELEGAFAV
jgi:hypothetical protein